MNAPHHPVPPGASTLLIASPVAVWAKFWNDPAISAFPRAALARALPQLSVRRIAAGEIVWRAGEAADQLYFMLTGEIEISTSHSRKTLDGGMVGLEAALGFNHYRTSVRATQGCLLIGFPAQLARRLAEASPKAAADMMQTLNQQAFDLPAEASQASPAPARASIVPPLGWTCAILLPPAVLQAGFYFGMAGPVCQFLALLTVTVILWMFRLVPMFVGALTLLVGPLILELAPGATILAGFGSEGFFSMLSVFCIGLVIINSGLSYRFLLWILKHIPVGRTGYNLSLFLIGAFLTPLIPTLAARAYLMAPLTLDMSDSLQYRHGGRAITRQAAAATAGFSLLSPIFLTSNPTNYVVLGLLPAQVQAEFHFLGWLTAGLCTAVLLLLAQVFCQWLFYREQHAPEISRLSPDRIATQLALLGPVKTSEWVAIGTILIFVFSVATFPLHDIRTAWIGLALTLLLLGAQALKISEFSKGIDWSFLALFGAMVAMVNIVKYLKLDQVLIMYTGDLAAVMSSSFPAFLAFTIVIMIFIRLAIPSHNGALMAAPLLLALGNSAGFHPWVIGFSFLLISEIWFFPYQCMWYQIFRDKTGGGPIYDERRFLMMNALLQLLKCAALFASIPYWKALNLL